MKYIPMDQWTVDGSYTRSYMCGLAKNIVFDRIAFQLAINIITRYL